MCLHQQGTRIVSVGTPCSCARTCTTVAVRPAALEPLPDVYTLMGACVCRHGMHLQRSKDGPRVLDQKSKVSPDLALPGSAGV